MRKAVPMHAMQARTRLWRSMRALRRFTVADLEATSEATANHARKYVKKLLVAGYLRVVEAKREGVAGGHPVYQLLRNTGPEAPRMGKGGLLDPNISPTPAEPGDEWTRMRKRDYDRALLCVRACAGMTDDEIRLKAGVRA